MNIKDVPVIGKVKVGIQGKLSYFLKELATLQNKKYPDLVELGNKYDLDIKRVKEPLNLFNDALELGFIIGKDIIILYDYFFVLISNESFLSYYETVEPVDSNVFKCKFFEIELDKKEKRRILTKIKESEKEEQEIIITTTPSIEGYTIIKYLGPVFNAQVYKLDVFEELFANIGDLFGGRSKGFTNKYASLFQQTYSSLINEVRRRKGNAIVGLNFMTQLVETPTGEKTFLGIFTGAEVRERKIMLSVTGTIVKVVPNR